MSSAKKIEAESSEVQPEPAEASPAVEAESVVSAAPGNGSELSPEFTATIYPGPDGSIPTEFALACKKLEASLGQPLWLLVQNRFEDARFVEIDEPIRLGFFRERQQLRECEGAALLIDSPGGSAQAAFQIATLFRRHCGHFTAVVPRWAKSAATLLTLGADVLYMGHDAELGPLDAQLWDEEAERPASALDEVQALERLNSAALVQVDQAMFLLVPRTQKKTDVLLPMVLSFVAAMMQPLLEKIDAVHYTQRSRVLKVAEDYAIRLLKPRYDKDDSERIARRLVNSYAEHGFVIDRDEVDEILEGLPTPSDDVAAAIDQLEDFLTHTRLTAIGRVQEKSEVDDGDKS